MAPSVGIVILNWNQEKDTSECLRSLKNLDYGNYFIILVDNGSKDGSDRNLKNEFPYVNLIKNNENLGFAEGNNIGMRHALTKQADYIFLLNNDTVIDSQVLKVLVDVAEKEPAIGILGAINYYYDYPEKVFSAGGHFNWWTSKLVTINGDLINKHGWRILEKAHFVPGSSIFIKRDVIEKIGMLDPDFFIYYEEADLCMRAKRAGYKVMPVRGAKILHKVAITFKRFSPVEYYLYTRNLLLFMKRNCPRLTILTFFLFDIIKITFRSTALFFSGERKKAKAVIYGFIDFLKGNFSKGRLEQFL